MLSETLYTLRKERGLSQEQLAEKLHVSRQSISKWEQGISMPETEKLLLLSEFFGVSLDELISSKKEPPSEELKAPIPINSKFLIGIIICLGGILGLFIWGLISIFSPSASDKIGASSVITLDGNGIFLLICVAAIAFGAWFLLKTKRS